jgi:hypothetical protein
MKLAWAGAFDSKSSAEASLDVVVPTTQKADKTTLGKGGGVRDRTTNLFVAVSQAA